MSKLWKMTVAVAAIVMLAAGCGGDDDDDDVGADVDADVDADTDLGDLAFGDRDCLEALQAWGAAFAGVGAAFSGASNELEEQGEALRELADEAPDEIKADIELFADAYGEFIVVMAEADYDPSSGQAPPQEVIDASERFSDEDLQEASADIEAWFAENCERN